jgi:hypothetical protein
MGLAKDGCLWRPKPRDSFSQAGFCREIFTDTMLALDPLPLTAIRSKELRGQGLESDLLAALVLRKAKHTASHAGRMVGLNEDGADGHRTVDRDPALAETLNGKAAEAKCLI